MIPTTTTATEITYDYMIDGESVSTLTLDAGTRLVLNVETARDHQRNGYARALWAAANADATCYHAIEHHRTDEGDAFANAVGGETIDPADDFEPSCSICTADDDTDY